MKKVTYPAVNMFLALILLPSTGKLYAQNEKSHSVINAGADLMSRYVWRGLDYGGSPSIQPYIELGAGNFTLGAWGAYTISISKANDMGVQEMDLYATYNIAGLLTVGVTDYFFPREADYNYNYFDYGSDTSDHIIEGMASFNGLENLPLTFMMGYNFLNDESNSLYFELGYSFSILDLFIGAGNGIYLTGDKNFCIVNLGFSGSREIPVTDNFSLPVSVSLITNPEAKHVHLVFGISL